MINKTQLKSYFETGDRPTQQQFGQLIDGIPFDFPTMSFFWGELGTQVTTGQVPTNAYERNQQVQEIELHKKLLAIAFQSSSSDWLNYSPILEVFRYRTKKTVSYKDFYPYHRKAGFIKETEDNALYNMRPAEIPITATIQHFDIKPEKYYTYYPNGNRWKTRGRRLESYKKAGHLYNFVKFRIRLTDERGEFHYSPLSETIAIEALTHYSPAGMSPVRLDITYNRV